MRNSYLACLPENRVISNHLFSFSLFAFIFVFLELASAPAAKAEFRQPPNSRIAIDLDKSFTPSPRFSGFTSAETGASYVMIEMPAGAYDELKTMPEHEAALKERGLSDAKIGRLDGRGGEYVYFTATQTQNGTEFAKFILVLLENGVTGFVTANIPKTALDSGALSRKQIENILATVKIADKAAAKAKLFKLGYLGPLKLSATIAGTGELYNTSGAGPESGVNRMTMEPTLMVAPSLSQDIIGDVTDAAKKRFQSLSGLKNTEILGEKPVTIGGLQGYQITAESIISSSDDKIAVHFAMLAGETGGYFILFGTTPIAQKDKFMPELQKVIFSFELAGL
jgi:hypothetical protein